MSEVDTLCVDLSHNASHNARGGAMKRTDFTNPVKLLIYFK